MSTVLAPPAFRLPKPLASDGYPAPSPPRYLKHQVYEQPDVFSKVDEHAIQVAQIQHPSFRDLVWHLLFKYNLNDLEMARTIFRWLASKEMNDIRFDECLPGSPEEFLVSFGAGKVALADIFEFMCSFCSLPCITVSGHAKAVDYLPGDRFRGSQAIHSWNVVFIRGSWQLIDVHWAARHLSSCINSSENVVYEYDDFYFMMEPQQAIYSHFPDDPVWQLLPNPLDLSQFESLPLTRPQFFKCEMDFLGHHHAVIHAHEGLLDMALGFLRPTGFAYRLRFLSNSSRHKDPESLLAAVTDFSDMIPGIDSELKNFLLQETTKDRVIYHFRLPITGVYYLTIYGQEMSQLAIGRENIFRTACEYKVICDSPTPVPQPYPNCHDVNWGPSWSHMRHYGLEPDHIEGIITVRPERTETSTTQYLPATLNIRFARRRPEVNLLARLHKASTLDDTSDQYQHMPEQQSVFRVTLPEPGEYGYEIYANESADGDTYTHVCQYLLRYEAPPGHTAIPRLTASGADAGPSPETAKSWQRSNGTTQPPVVQPYAKPKSYAIQKEFTPDRNGSDLATPMSNLRVSPPSSGPATNQTRSNHDDGSRRHLTLQSSAPTSQDYPYGETAPGRYGPSSNSNYASDVNQYPPYQQQYDRLISAHPEAYVPSPRVTSYRPDQSTANWGSTIIQREPPKEFSLHPLVEESYAEKPRPQELPEANVSYGSFENFRRIDEHAVSVSQQQQDNFKQLIWQLIYARNITDELEKVRVIFLWLCTKDLHKMNFDNVKPDSPEEILMGIRTGKSTYAQIFYTLCKYAGLHCKLLLGYAKGAEYAPGMHFTGGQGEHSWNAVLINKVWRLVDCHWAARRLIGKRPSPNNVRYGLDMFYFLANPGQLIYTHFPHEPDWQLLRHPITLAEFENLAPVKSAFFKCNLDLVTHRDAVIVCTEPEICVAIAFPPGAENYLSFTFGLSVDDAKGSEDYKGLPLRRFGRQEISVRDHKSLFYIRPPAPGAYKLLIYTKQHPESRGSVNGLPDLTDDFATGNTYGAVCEYRVVARFGPNVSLPPYPPCQSSSYGPSELARNYPIQPRTSEYTLKAVRGCAELRFSLGTTPGNPPVRMLAKLRCTFVSEEVLARSLLQRTTSGNKEAVFTALLPEPGEYGLEVYANNPSKNENSFFMIWQYIILSDSDSGIRGLPNIPPAYLGPLPRFETMGLVAVSHPDPFVQAQTGELCIQINHPLDLPVRIMAQLINATNNASEDCSHHVMQQMRDNQVYFLVRFPCIGFFKFQIYALPMSEPGESLPVVMNYLLQSTQLHRTRTGQVMCFPQQFAHWKDGCYLHSPLDGVLSSSNSHSYHSPDVVPFKLVVPKARAVAVVAGDDWTHLTKMGDCWEGQVSLKHHWGRIRQLAVCASLNAADGTYSTILEYQITN